MSRSFDLEIAEEAADWAIRLDADDLSKTEQQAFIRWVRTSPAHMEELLIAASLLAGIEAAAPAMTDRIERLLAADGMQALAGAPGGTGQADAGTINPALRRKWKITAVYAMAASVALAVLGVAMLSGRHPSVPDDNHIVASTALGQQRELTLSDGSHVYLNTQSSIDIHISKTVRTAELVSGEAYFEVAPDQKRPFRVKAGDMAVEVVGTAFNLRYLNHKAALAVREGIVAVGPMEQLAKTSPARDVTEDRSMPIKPGIVLVSQGEMAELRAPQSTVVVTSIAAASVAAWRTNQLIFNDATLADIAMEFNRYNAVKLVIDDALRDKRFSGVFHANDPQSLVDFLHQTAHISIIEKNGQLRIIEPVQK